VLVLAGTLWTPEEELRGGWVRVEGGRIVALGQGPAPSPAVGGGGADAGSLGDGPVLDARGLTVCPGFVDLHIHGAFGHDLMEGLPAVAAVSAGLPRYGCTAYLPTTVTAPWVETLRAVAALAEAVEHPPAGARPVGLHLEGPFLNPARAGMQAVAHMRRPSLADAERLLAAGRGHVRLVTLAPELPGGLELVGHLARCGVVPAMAHSDASYEQARAAADAGARHVTHCFNAMRPLHHRDPGLVGAALDEERLSAEAIADGVHVHPVALRLLWRSKGWRRTALVTDAMPGAGAPEGTYRFGGHEVAVRAGQARLPDGTLAGSVLTMDRAVRVLVGAGVPPREAVAMASLTPARVAGLVDVGRVAPGCRADLVALDAELRVVWTMVGGRVVWRAG
jgi:N-acetylglucosamine-6-phosphate deacetylase